MNWLTKVLLGLLWRPISSAPIRRKVLVVYAPYGKNITTCARYYPENTLPASDDSDDEFSPAGWYEESFENEDLFMLTVEPVKWMALPRT